MIGTLYYTENMLLYLCNNCHFTATSLSLILLLLLYHCQCCFTMSLSSCPCHHQTIISYTASSLWHNHCHSYCFYHCNLLFLHTRKSHITIIVCPLYIPFTVSILGFCVFFLNYYINISLSLSPSTVLLLQALSLSMSLLCDRLLFLLHSQSYYYWYWPKY